MIIVAVSFLNLLSFVSTKLLGKFQANITKYNSIQILQELFLPERDIAKQFLYVNNMHLLYIQVL